MNDKDIDNFSNQYYSDEREIFVLTNNESGGASKFYDSWKASQYFLAYIDIESNRLEKGNGRINWLLSDKECNELGTTYPYYFEKATIYRLKVRELIDKTVPEGGLPSAYNGFMVVDILEKNVQNDILSDILNEYNAPVLIIDKKLGEFELNKDYRNFEGNIIWLGNEVSVHLEVDMENKESWEEVMNILKSFNKKQEKQDVVFRNYAAEELTDLANDWLEDENGEITKKNFIERISLSQLVIHYEGDFTAYYNDDDIFYGHVICIYGNIESGISSATIAG